MLKEKGIVIARRTVAKYRDEFVNILPSNLRKILTGRGVYAASAPVLQRPSKTSTLETCSR